MMSESREAPPGYVPDESESWWRQEGFKVNPIWAGVGSLVFGGVWFALVHVVYNQNNEKLDGNCYIGLMLAGLCLSIGAAIVYNPRIVHLIKDNRRGAPIMPVVGTFFIAVIATVFILELYVRVVYKLTIFGETYVPNVPTNPR